MYGTERERGTVLSPILRNFECLLHQESLRRIAHTHAHILIHTRCSANLRSDTCKEKKQRRERERGSITCDSCHCGLPPVATLLIRTHTHTHTHTQTHTHRRSHARSMHPHTHTPGSHTFLHTHQTDTHIPSHNLAHSHQTCTPSYTHTQHTPHTTNACP